MCENADVAVKIIRRVLLANLRLRQYDLPLLYDLSTAPLGLEVRMLKAEVIETMLYVCATWSPSVAHLAILRTAHHRLLLRCIVGQKIKRRDGSHTLSYADALAKTDCENVETTVRKRRILSAGFVARMDNERLPKRVIFWGSGRGKGLLGRARTGLNGLSRARPIVVQVAYRSETLGVGSKEAG